MQHGDVEHGVDCMLDGTSPAEVVFSVTNGGHIPDDVLPTLFDPFRNRGTHRSRGDGLGLGLYIVDQIARAHGGHVDVDSDGGQTTTFRVHLPRHPRADRRSTFAQLGPISLGLQD